MHAQINTNTITIFYKTGDFMKQHDPPMKIIDIFFERKLKWYFEDTVMFSCLKLKHKLLFDCIGFHFVFPHLHLHLEKINTNNGFIVYTTDTDINMHNNYECCLGRVAS